jgi:hypothetical protein
MKIVIWLLCAFLALIWTAACWIGASLVGWLAAGLAGGTAAELAARAAKWPAPEWLGLWFDPAVLAWMQEAFAAMLVAMEQGLPLLGTAAGWLVPLIWIVWGMGAVGLLILAGCAQWIAAWIQRRFEPAMR